ncbi:hypothetical protein CRUP_017588 [Coryphaenoides rupestris]|nr:hypothetical protein CRUP_017588 [Coryphaenoides rupestris]
MAITRLVRCFVILLSTHCCLPALAVVLKTDNPTPWTNEFESVELSCLIESISTNNPRIEWKKIVNSEPSYVFFDNKVSGDLENRARIREPATLVITNATRSDTADYRCEVTAPNDQKIVDEILISLVSAELRCVEDEGFPKSQYQWFINKEEIPDDPKTSARFFNSSYMLNGDTGTLRFSEVRREDAGDYHCRAKNDAGHAECSPQKMEVYDLNVTGIVLGVLVVVVVLLCITLGICCAYKRGYFTNQKEAGNKVTSDTNLHSSSERRDHRGVLQGSSEEEEGQMCSPVSTQSCLPHILPGDPAARLKLNN